MQTHHAQARNLRVVTVPFGKIVRDNAVVPVAEQKVSGVGTDVSGATNDEYFGQTTLYRALVGHHRGGDFFEDLRSRHGSQLRFDMRIEFDNVCRYDLRTAAKALDHS